MLSNSPDSEVKEEQIIDKLEDIVDVKSEESSSVVDDGSSESPQGSEYMIIDGEINSSTEALAKAENSDSKTRADNWDRTEGLSPLQLDIETIELDKEKTLEKIETVTDKGTVELDCSNVKEVEDKFAKGNYSEISSKNDDDLGGATCGSTGKDKNNVYHIKWITYKNKNNVPVITQNENGPCPLIAIMNVLLLKNKVQLTGNTEVITPDQLMTYIGNCILENAPKPQVILSCSN